MRVVIQEVVPSQWRARPHRPKCQPAANLAQQFEEPVQRPADQNGEPVSLHPALLLVGGRRTTSPVTLDAVYSCIALDRTLWSAVDVDCDSAICG